MFAVFLLFLTVTPLIAVICHVFARFHDKERVDPYGIAVLLGAFVFFGYGFVTVMRG